MGYQNRRRRIAAAQNTGQEATGKKFDVNEAQTGVEAKNLSPATGTPPADRFKKKSSRG